MDGRRQAATKNESGQAILEYILVLFVSVMLILGLMYQFSTAFRKYAQNFFGNYVACLIETGELPGSQACATEFVAFDVNSGSPLVGPKTTFANNGSGGANGKNGGSNKAGQASGADGKGDGSGGGEVRAGGSGAPVSTSGAGGGSGPTGFRFGLGKKEVTAVGNISDEQGKSAYANFDSGSGVAPTSSAVGNLARGERRHTVALGYSYGGDDKDEKEKDRPKTATAGKADQGNKGLKPKKTAVNMNRAPAKAASSEDREFHISDLLRFLLIIAIVIIVLVFFGGQLLQISKAQEK
jgi:hypothetical protein